MQSPAINPNAPGSAPWYAHRWPWLLMLGPFVVVVAGAVTIWLAFSRQDALVVDDYYKQGKAINQDLHRDRVAAKLQVQLDLRYDPAAGKLIGRIASPAGAPDGRLTLRLVHSTLPEKDLVREAQPDGQGNFSVNLALLEQANWQVLVEDRAREWRLTGEWTWPKQASVTLRPMLMPADG